MSNMFITFLCKIADNALSTLKTMYLHKGKYFASSMFNAAGTFFYMTAIVNAIKDNSLGSIIAMCIATFLGSYLPAKYIEKKEGDKLFVYDITTNSFNEGMELIDELKDLNIPFKSATTYNNKLEKVMEIKVFCSTKQESLMIKDIISNDYKYHAYIAKDY